MSTTTGGGRREDELREALRGRADAAEPALDVDAIAARGARIRRARRQGVVAVAAGVFAVAALGGVVWATLPGSGGDTIAASAPDERAEEESADDAAGSGLADGDAAAVEEAAGACAVDSAAPAPGLVVTSALPDVLAADAPVAGRVEVRNDSDEALAGAVDLRVELLARDGTLLAAGDGGTVRIDLAAGASAEFDLVAAPVPCGDGPITAAAAVRAVATVQPDDGSEPLRADGAAEPVRVD